MAPTAAIDLIFIVAPCFEVLIGSPLLAVQLTQYSPYLGVLRKCFLIIPAVRKF
jgi:hypothetical protein